MPSNPSRVLILRARLLEMTISGAAIGLGLFMWLSMSGSNSGINLLAGAALLVADLLLLQLGVYLVGDGKRHQAVV
jgi:hypothetical protein